MQEKFIEIIRILAHISEQMKSLSEEIDKLYNSLSDKEILALLFEEDNK
jgi:hypothetical protein